MSENDLDSYDTNRVCKNVSKINQVNVSFQSCLLQKKFTVKLTLIYPFDFWERNAKLY